MAWLLTSEGGLTYALTYIRQYTRYDASSDNIPRYVSSQQNPSVAKGKRTMD